MGRIPQNMRHPIKPVQQYKEVVLLYTKELYSIHASYKLHTWALQCAWSLTEPLTLCLKISHLVNVLLIFSMEKPIVCGYAWHNPLETKNVCPRPLQTRIELFYFYLLFLNILSLTVKIYKVYCVLPTKWCGSCTKFVQFEQVPITAIYTISFKILSFLRNSVPSCSIL